VASVIARNYRNFARRQRLLTVPLARLPRLPDLLTTANLGCGVASILLVSQGQLTIACVLVFAAALFDVFDGLAARALGGGTPLGAQLDSLADMVSFGVAPGVLCYRLIGDPITSSLLEQGMNLDASMRIGYLTVLVIPVASAWRLAKFNIDPRQTHGFLGLPTPANALFWSGLTLGLMDTAPEELQFLERLNAWALLGIMLTLCILMLSELPLPSLKFKHKGWKGNEVIFLLIGIGASLVLLYGVLAVPLVLIIYLLSPLWGKLFKNHVSSVR
jgi:CDP-diacylglycerol--serine O-phosphatidyltransferase